MTRLVWAFSLALLASTGPVLAETVRPKPRPTLASAAIPPAPVSSGTAGQSGSAAAVPPPELRPLGPPAPRNQAAAVPAPRDPNKGAVTNLPLPRFVSLKTGEGNARRGPGLSHRIDWVFTRAGMPLKITAEHEHWRRIEDAEGSGGWVHYSLLSGVRTVMVSDPMVTFHAQADAGSSALFQAEAGVVARVIECHDGWCRLSVDGERGWAPVSGLWGVGSDEVIE